MREMHALHLSLSQMLTSAVDLTDILRAEVVLAVSAFDFFVHEITRLGMLECHAGVRAPPDAFKKFQIPMESAQTLTPANFDAIIRTKHGYLSFQHPDKVAEAIRLYSPIELWNSISLVVSMPAKAIKTDLTLIIDRRNKIAHEADTDPSYPGQRWPITRGQVEHIFDFLEQIARGIYKATT